MVKKLLVKCPKCKKKFNYYSSDYRPFCCEKCKMVDLGTWLNEGYTISGNPVDLDEIDDDNDDREEEM